MLKRPAELLRGIVLVGVMMVVAGGCESERPRQFRHAEAVVDYRQVHRVTTAVPFPRGVAMKDGTLYVLSRGRVRDFGGTDPKLDDKAGTLWAVDPATSEVFGESVADEVRANARVLAEPTEPPFRLLDRSVANALDDSRTDRPYCILRYDPGTRSFYFCAFSGIDKPPPDYSSTQPADYRPDNYFRKNHADALYRYDTRTSRWHLLYRPAALATAPTTRAAATRPLADGPADPFFSGPDNCLVVGNYLYVACKESSTLLRFDLSEIARNPYAQLRDRRVVAGSAFRIGDSVRRYLGHSMLAVRGEYLYLGFRTSSVIVRIRLKDLEGTAATAAGPEAVPPVPAELLARFDPYNPETGRSADLTDMAFGPAVPRGQDDAQIDDPAKAKLDADLYVISARPARVYRFTPDPQEVFDARTDAARVEEGDDPVPPDGEKYDPWVNLSELTGNPRMKCEAIYVDDRGRAFITSSDRVPAAHGETGLAGVVYRIDPTPPPTPVQASR